MAVNDHIWIDGQPVLFKSSGTVPSYIWVDGRPVVIHEYVAGGPVTLEIDVHDCSKVKSALK